MLDLPPPVPPPLAGRSWLPPRFPASAVLFGAVLAVLAMLLFWKTATTVIHGERQVNLAGVLFTLVVATSAVATLYSLLRANVIAVAVLFNVMLAILLIACVPREGEFTKYLFEAVASRRPIGEADHRLLFGLVVGTAYFVGAIVGSAIALVRTS